MVSRGGEGAVEGASLPCASALLLLHLWERAPRGRLRKPPAQERLPQREIYAAASRERAEGARVAARGVERNII